MLACSVFYQGAFAQSINLGQHILWQYSYSNELRHPHLSSTGNTVAFITGIEPSTLTLLDGATGDLIWTFTPTGLTPENRTISGLDVSANGEYLAIGTTGGSVYLFHRSSSEIVQHWQTTDPISAIAVSELGTFIAIAFAGHVYFLSRLEGTPLWGETIADPPYTVVNMTMDQSGTTLAASTSDNNLYYIRTGDGEILWETPLPMTTTALQLDAAGTTLLATMVDRVLLFSEGGGLAEQYLQAPRVFAFSGQGNRIAIAPNNTMYIYNQQSALPESNHTFVGSQISSVALTFDGNILLVGTHVGTLYTMDPSDFAVFWTLPLDAPIIRLLTPNIGDFFLAATTTRLIGLRIASVTGFLTYLTPIVLIIGASTALGILTYLLVRPRRTRRSLATEIVE